MRLTRRHINALRALAAAGCPLFARMIPDGNGDCGPMKYVSGATLIDLRKLGLIETRGGLGHKITDAGREALKQEGK